jgi:MoxR-like ATPase
MSTQVPFKLVDPAAPRAGRAALLARRRIPAALSSHKAAAPHFQPGEALLGAINVALSIGAPLLLTGEPGTGKTQVAHYLAWYFEIPLYQLDVRSTTTAEDLLYQFDHVAYFHAAHDPGRAGRPLSRGEFVRPGPLWRACEAKDPSVVLIDEIDKAPRDLPNDLLGVLDQRRFEVPEQGRPIALPQGASPPIVVITSNSERRLPEPFLRRCVFHHIEFNEELLRQAVQARRGDFGALPDEVVGAAIERLLELRRLELRKHPATAEFLLWLAVLAARGEVDAGRLREAPLQQLPALSVLVKDRDDLRAL